MPDTTPHATFRPSRAGWRWSVGCDDPALVPAELGTFETERVALAEAARLDVLLGPTAPIPALRFKRAVRPAEPLRNQIEWLRPTFSLRAAGATFLPDPQRSERHREPPAPAGRPVPDLQRSV